MITITQKKADLLIALIAAAWGSSYIFMKMGLGTIGVFNLAALRFGLAFLLTAPFFYKRLFHTDKKTLLYGAILGFTLICVLAMLMFGLKVTSASSAGFLAGTTVVFVPLLQTAIRRKRPNAKIISSVILIMSGIALLTIDRSFKIEFQSLLCVLAALIYAVQIILTSYFSLKADPLTLGVLQLGIAGLCGLIASFIFETPTLPQTQMEWIAVLALSIVCSAFGFVLQPLAQKHTTPERTGVLFSLEPVFSAIFGFAFLGEMLKVHGYAGALLVFGGVILSGLSNKVFSIKVWNWSLKKHRG